LASQAAPTCCAWPRYGRSKDQPVTTFSFNAGPPTGVFFFGSPVEIAALIVVSNVSLKSLKCRGIYKVDVQLRITYFELDRKLNWRARSRRLVTMKHGGGCDWASNAFESEF
jgi:hypothetical protein